LSLVDAAHDGPFGKAYTGLIMFAAGITCAVVVQLVARGESQRVVIEKDERGR
jgi:hypothetical protein